MTNQLTANDNDSISLEVVSSWIQSLSWVGTEGDTGYLMVNTVQGVLTYSNVPYEVVEELATAPSVGRAYNSLVRNNPEYTYQPESVV